MHTPTAGNDSSKMIKVFRSYIGRNSISIREDTEDGASYVEWSLNCSWDDEHGLAAVTQRNRLIDLDRGEPTSTRSSLTTAPSERN